MKTTNLIFGLALFISAMFYSCTQTSSINASCPTCFACLNDTLVVDTIPGGCYKSGYLRPTTFTNQVPFINKNGTPQLDSYIIKTQLGFVGGFAIEINVDTLLPGVLPHQFRFVMTSRTPANAATWVNIKLDNNSLIATTPDSLSYFLTPFGYTVNHYPMTGLAEGLGPYVGMAQLDSFVITNTTNSFHKVTIGRNFDKFEIRSICFTN